MHRANISVFNKELNFIAQIDDYESLIFERALTTYAQFQITINVEKNHTKKLQLGYWIMLDDYENHTGIIHQRQIQVNDDGSEVVTIKGYTLNSLLSRRITLPPAGSAQWSKKGPAETVIKALIDANTNGAPDAKRHIDFLEIAADQSRGESITFDSRYKQLDEEVAELCSQSGLGVELSLDYKKKKIVVEVIQGLDRTVNNGKNSWVLFSQRLDNLVGQNYLEADNDQKNMAYVAGQGEGVERVIVEIGDETGIDRKELFVDARDLEDATNLPHRGQEKLAECKSTVTFEGKPIQSNYTFEQDYFLGDMVTLEKENWGVTMDTQITSVTETWEDGYTLDVQFGHKIPTLAEKIKRIVN